MADAAKTQPTLNVTDDGIRKATGSSSPPLQRELLGQLTSALWLPEWKSPEQMQQEASAAYEQLQSIAPEDGLEGMLAVQMVATHNAAMDCLRRAMLPEQTFERREQNLKHAAKLLGIYTRQMEALDKHRGKGQQKITVEHVTVEAGGQAIVGNVETAPKRKRTKPPAPSLEHKPDVSVPLEQALGSQKERGPISAKTKGMDPPGD